MTEPALLVLEDGTQFHGASIGAAGQAVGEVVFNTAMSGYQEILTDPSYFRQIVTLTYPHIGNVGTNVQDFESARIFAAGLVIRDLSAIVSSWRAECGLAEFLRRGDAVAIADIDTRKLTRIIREKGAQAGCIVAGAAASAEAALAAARAFPGLEGMDLAREVSTAEPYLWDEGSVWPERKRANDPGAAGPGADGRRELANAPDATADASASGRRHGSPELDGANAPGATVPGGGGRSEGASGPYAGDASRSPSREAWDGWPGEANDSGAVAARALQLNGMVDVFEGDANDSGATAARAAPPQEGALEAGGLDDGAPHRAGLHVVAYDFGIKRNILRLLADRGCRITVVPATTTASEVMALAPDGVFLSNGPGDPEPCDYAIEAIRALLDIGPPVFGICLGHQLLALASGAKTEKMKFGHHGANHPVLDIDTGRVLITSQNHGFAVAEASLPDKLRPTHRSLFDGTLQGIECRDRPAFSFQGHPEASPGPHDVSELFERFVQSMRASRASAEAVAK